jgi:Flp pilus assembly protein TadG
MTGQAQAQNLTAAQFKQTLCAQASALFNCANINVNVQTFTSFSNVAMLNPVQNGQLNAATMNYNPGAPGDIVVVQAFYLWPVFAAPLSFNLANVNGVDHLLVATAVFRNEPT